MTDVIFNHKEGLKFVYQFKKDIWEQLQFWYLF